MIIYVVLWKDRHADDTVHLFTDIDVAIVWAREKAIEYCRFEDDLEFKHYDSELKNGWVYSATYSGEGDGFLVMKKLVNEEIDNEN